MTSTTPHCSAVQWRTYADAFTAARTILIVAHQRPDPDTIGATIALWHFARSLPHAPSCTIACADPFPRTLPQELAAPPIVSLERVQPSSYDLIVGADSIDRGFLGLIAKAPATVVTVAFDHHEGIAVPARTRAVIDCAASSTCEILTRFFQAIAAPLTPPMANALLFGIIGDTNAFHNPNTAATTLDTAAILVAAGGAVAPMADAALFTKSPAVLRLWGQALRRAVRLPSGIVVTALPWSLVQAIRLPRALLKEELKNIASFLMVPKGVRAALVLLQLTETTVKGSLRAVPERGLDLVATAALFGGGGLPLASGFEVRGRITEGSHGDWRIVRV